VFGGGALDLVCFVRRECAGEEEEFLRVEGVDHGFCDGGVAEVDWIESSSVEGEDRRYGGGRWFGVVHVG